MGVSVDARLLTSYRMSFFSHASYFNLVLSLVDAHLPTWIIAVVLLPTPGREGFDGFSHSYKRIQFIDAYICEQEADDAVGIEYQPVTAEAGHVRNHESIAA